MSFNVKGRTYGESSIIFARKTGAALGVVGGVEVAMFSDRLTLALSGRY